MTNPLHLQTLEIGSEILRKLENQPKASIFNKDWWYGSIMDWSMKNEHFKTQMFRFVDVLPSLNSGSEVARHLKEYFAESGDQLPSVFNVGVGLGSLAPSLMAGAIRKNVTQMAKMFIIGENPKEALDGLKKARAQSVGFTVDILGEATLSEKEALEYQSRYLEMISWLAQDSAKWSINPLLDQDALGTIPRVNVSVKLTALYSQMNDRAWEKTKSICKERLRPIFKSAMEKNVFINLDMEHYGVKDLTLEIFKELLLEPEFKTWRHVGCVIQAYLRDSKKDLEDLSNFAKLRGTPFTVRLVKGAYWDSETIEAEQKRWKIPVYTNKPESDANYEACSEVLLKNYPHIMAAFGSHNVRSIAYAMALAKSLNVPSNAFEIQMLYGMGDSIKKTLVDMSYRVREYAPVGELIPGMAYLVRRLLENTSNQSWLRGKFVEGKSPEELLKDPREGLVNSTGELPVKDIFYNESPKDFAESHVRAETQKAISQLKSQLPIKVPVVIDGKTLNGGNIFSRENPSNKSEVVSTVQMATTAQADQAVAAAKKGFSTWSKVSATERAQTLEKLADLMHENFYNLMATQVLEVGKPWDQAEGDVGEAIDFCRYYARQMREIANPTRVGNSPGEVSMYQYSPKGVTLVIAPWNFPLAILTGMATAALVTGNTVILKPAEQSSGVAYGLYQLMMKAGFPPSAVQFLPGLGEVVGAHVVKSPDVATIVFTGSKAVGLKINEVASVVQPGQEFIKKCILELGGKNALIIDTDADLDEAVDGVLYSAFGFAGQKCSAASRVIVLSDLYERFVERLVASAESINHGSAENPECYVGPVVDEESHSRLIAAIENGKKSGKLLFQGKTVTGGHFVPPTIFGNVDPKSPLAQNEFFGPLLALIKAKDVEEAIEIANNTEYALTGGIFSRSPESIKKVKQGLEVGNVYINRSITGALVERHPFGGFKMSGIGGKAGGPDYLRQFMNARVVVENTMRRGFAPPEELGEL